MHCNFRLMGKVALSFGSVVAVAAYALPEARALLAAGAPLLLALVCPVSMIAMVFMMGRSPQQSATVLAQPSASDGHRRLPATDSGQDSAPAGAARSALSS